MQRDFPLPKRLINLLDSGIWPQTNKEALKQNLQPIVSINHIHRFAPDEERIYLYEPPFHTVADEVKGHGEAFWSQWGALSEISPELSLIIGDFGLGSDTAIILDYRHDNPSVLRLSWRKAKPNTWVRCADTFDQFIDMLGL